jgi:hypothetical protein
MTSKEFSEVCDLLPADSPISIGYRQFNLTGKLIGCWEGSMVIDFHGQQAIWPRELCERREATYPVPSYS